MDLKPKLNDHTALEFHALVNKIWAVDVPKQNHDQLIDHFDRIVGHPAGADLLFYPADLANSNSPDNVVHLVRTWHHQQGTAAFKGEDIPVVKAPVGPLTPLARSFGEVVTLAADVTVSAQFVDDRFTVLQLKINALRSQQSRALDIKALENGMHALETAEHEAVMAVRKFELWKMKVEHVRSSAQRNRTYALSDQTQWQNVVQQSNATWERYETRLAEISQRHRVLHEDAQAMWAVAQESLSDLRRSTKSIHTLNAPLDFSDQRAHLLLTGRSLGLLWSQQTDLLKSLRSAVAEFAWRNTTGESGISKQRACVLSFAFCSRADAQVFAVSVPLSDLLPIEGQHWHELADMKAEVGVPYCLGTRAVPAEPGKMFQGLREIQTLMQVYVTASASVDLATRVRVRAVNQNRDLPGFSFSSERSPAVSVHWTAPAGAEQVEPRPVGFVRSPRVPTIEVDAEPVNDRHDDYILVFPVESGLDPLYIAFHHPAQ